MTAVGEARPAAEVPVVKTSAAKYAALWTVLAVVGASTIAPSVASLWKMWTTDALKSVGMAIPVVSLVLVLRAWKGIGWRAEGTWWGFALLLAAAAGSWVQGQGNLVIVLSPQVSRVVPPPSLVFLLYGLAIALCAGGRRLLTAAMFPLLLLVMTNPVPQSFNLWIDLPLQRISADVARSLAIHLGQHLTPDSLRLMFTPEFGMFIAPGCDGMRGAVTMGLIALVAGYVYRFRWGATAAITLGAVLLGYVFNLLRLCLLVFYYLIALHLPWLQNKAEQGDYVIGAALFLLGTILLLTAIQKLRDRRPNDIAVRTLPEDASEQRSSMPRKVLLAAVTVAALLGCFWIPQAIAIVHPRAMLVEAQPFPEHLGSYTRQRVWNESITETGTVIYVWAEYARAGGEDPIEIGVSPVVDWHNPLVCHSVRGETPVWQGQIAATTGGAEVEFISGFYNDGVTQFVEASTMCSRGGCGEHMSGASHLGLVYSLPRFHLLRGAIDSGSTRVLLRTETTNMALTADAAREELMDTLRGFLQNVKLDELTQGLNR